MRLISIIAVAAAALAAIVAYNYAGTATALQGRFDDATTRSLNDRALVSSWSFGGAKPCS